MHSPNSASIRRQHTLWVWVLVLLVVFCWPKTYGPSVNVVPFAVGLFAVALAGLLFRPTIPTVPAAWLVMLVALAWWGPGTELLSKTGLLAAAAATAILISLGCSAAQQRHTLRALVDAILFAMVFHVAASWLQFFDVEHTLYPLVNLNPTIRPFGNFRQPNHLGTFSVLGLLAAWWRYRRGLDTAPATAVLALLACSGVVLSGSRTALVELVAVSICLLLWFRHGNAFERAVFVAAPLWVWLMTLGLQALLVMGTGDFQAVVERESSSLNLRVRYALDAWQLALKHPWWGVGWGELGRARFTELQGQNLQENTLNAHNLLLHLAAELGLLGATLVLVPALAMFWRLRPWVSQRTTHPTEDRTDAHWAWLVLVALATHSLTEYPLWYMPFLLPAAFAVGLLMGQRPPRQQRMLPQIVAPVLASTLALGTTLALLDYAHVCTAYTPQGQSLADPQKALDIQGTVLFQHYADRALLERVPLTPERVPEVLALTDRMMSRGPNNLLLWVRLNALCAAGQHTEGRLLASRFQAVSPGAYAQYRRMQGVDALRRCGL